MKQLTVIDYDFNESDKDFMDLAIQETDQWNERAIYIPDFQDWMYSHSVLVKYQDFEHFMDDSKESERLKYFQEYYDHTRSLDEPEFDLFNELGKSLKP